jgi:hypothetical protein
MLLICRQLKKNVNESKTVMSNLYNTMNKQNDITWAFSHIAWEAINTLENYCPEKLGDIKSKMEKLNNEWLRLATPNQNTES